MLRVLVCSERDSSRALADTLIGRSSVERFRAIRLEDACLLAATVCPSVILVDRDLPHAHELVTRLREQPATRHRSIAVMAWGDFEPSEVELLELGANAILRLPPDASWDGRLARLLSVPTRQESRLPVRLELEGDSYSAHSLNLSVGGMLLESCVPLPVHREVSFRFSLPDGTAVSGHGRVVRQASPTDYGLEFVGLESETREAIRDCVRSAAIELGGLA